MDVGGSPSAVASILNSSLETDIVTSIASGIGATSGLKHTSARMKILETLLILKKTMNENKLDCASQEIISNDTAIRIVLNNFQNILDDGNLLYGFGHYFFKGPEKFIDPRITILCDAIIAQNESIDLLNILNIAKNICECGLLKKNGKSVILPINSDGYWSVYLYSHFNKLAEIDNFIDLVPIFTTLTRIAGLIAYDFEVRKVKCTPKIS